MLRARNLLIDVAAVGQAHDEIASRASQSNSASSGPTGGEYASVDWGLDGCGTLAGAVIFTIDGLCKCDSINWEVNFFSAMRGCLTLQLVAPSPLPVLAQFIHEHSLSGWCHHWHAGSALRWPWGRSSYFVWHPARGCHLNPGGAQRFRWPYSASPTRRPMPGANLAPLMSNIILIP